MQDIYNEREYQYHDTNDTDKLQAQLDIIIPQLNEDAIRLGQLPEEINDGDKEDQQRDDVSTRSVDAEVVTKEQIVEKKVAEPVEKKRRGRKPKVVVEGGVENTKQKAAKDIKAPKETQKKAKSQGKTAKNVADEDSVTDQIFEAQELDIEELRKQLYNQFKMIQKKIGWWKKAENRELVANLEKVGMSFKGNQLFTQVVTNGEVIMELYGGSQEKPKPQVEKTDQKENKQKERPEKAAATAKQLNIAKKTMEIEKEPTKEQESDSAQMISEKLAQIAEVSKGAKVSMDSLNIVQFEFKMMCTDEQAVDVKNQLKDIKGISELKLQFL